MAIVVLVLWLFTAGAGFSLLATGNLSRARPTAPTSVAEATEAAAPATEPATATVTSSAQAVSTAQAAFMARATAATPAEPEPSAAQAAPAAQRASGPAQPAAKRQSRATRDRFAPPSLVAARNAPVAPGLRAVLEFAHPAFAIIGLGFWLGYTFVHYRPLGWIAFVLVTATICLGLTWFTANTRAAGRQPGKRPSFSTRLVVMHGGAAAVTAALAALTAFVLGR